LSNKIKIKKVLISVFDKTNILEISQFLINQNIEIYSSGGTYKHLKKNGIKVIEISKYTNSPEILDGRVKTLHPKVHGGILAKRNLPKHLKELKKNKINLIDLVIVNLYPFKKTVSSKSSFKECIENIDIGGPTLIRASAKNFDFVTTIIDPIDYEKIIDEMKKNKNQISKKTRLDLAIKAFNEISLYDMDISNWFSQIGNEKNRNFLIQSKIVKKLSLKVSGITNQKNFLINLGILKRAEIISKNLSFSKKTNIYFRVKRLVDKNLMGELFKVMLITKQNTNFQTGFKN